MAAPVVAGAVDVARAHLGHGDELRYLRWLSAEIPVASVILTSGNVDPWEVHEVTGRGVIWPAEDGGWQFIQGRPHRWSKPVKEIYPDAGTTADILAMLRDRGNAIWFYRPGATTAVLEFRPSLGSDTPRPFRLDPVLRYPVDPDRAAYRVRDPVAS